MNFNFSCKEQESALTDRKTSEHSATNTETASDTSATTTTAEIEEPEKAETTSEGLKISYVKSSIVH